MPRKVLIIEDDPTMQRGLKDNFEMEGYNVRLAADGELGLEMAMRPGLDLIVLDVMLPRLNGFDILRLLRQAGSQVPVLMLTARDEERDVVRGLEHGADDYVTKPFRLRELMARAAALVRRRGDGEGEFVFGDCRFLMEDRQLFRADKELHLSPKEYELLAFFVRHPDKPLSREKILNEVWGLESDVTPRTIDRFVTGLRAKIEVDAQNPKFLETVREVGYRFLPNTEPK